MVISEKKSFLNLMILVHSFSHKTFLWVTLDFFSVAKWWKFSLPQKKKTSGMHACKAFVIRFMIDWSWYTFHSMTIAWWKGHTTPREKHECVHERRKTWISKSIFQFGSLWCLLPHWQNQIIQIFKKTWIHFMNLKLLYISTIYSRLP
jgi:hypothetical protein